MHRRSAWTSIARMRLPVAFTIALVAMSGCTKHEEREITPWLKVDIRRPVTGTSGVVSIGSREERFDIEIGGRWRKLGIGHGSTYMVLGEGKAALVELHDGSGLQLVRADAPPRQVPGSLRSSSEEWQRRMGSGLRRACQEPSQELR